METKAFKSEYTGELFGTQKAYKDHIKEYKNQEKVKKDSLRVKESLHTPRLTATSLEDFRQKMFDMICKLNKNKEDKLLGLFFDDYYFSENVSNSHSCPIGVVTNWAERESNKPTSYPGWMARGVIMYSSEFNTSNERRNLEELLENFPGLNLADGNYGGTEYKGMKGYVLNYGFRFYLSDFPILEKQYKKFVVLKEKYNKWTEKTLKTIDEKNNSDKIITDYDTQITEYNDKIKKLQDELDSVRDLRSKRCHYNKELVLSKNIFQEFDETNNIGKSLFIESAKFLRYL